MTRSKKSAASRFDAQLEIAVAPGAIVVEALVRLAQSGADGPAIISGYDSEPGIR